MGRRLEDGADATSSMLLALLALVCQRLPPITPSGTSASSSLAFEAVRVIGAGSAATQGLSTVLNSRTYVQGVSWQADGTWITVVDKERRSTAQKEWDISSVRLEGDFHVQHVTTRQSNEFFVAGSTSNGRDVIERWTISSSQGAHFFSREQSTAGPGTEVVGNSAVTLGVTGGTYIPAGQRSSSVRQSREPIYRGDVFGGIATLRVDPDGRCLFVVGESPPALYRVPNHGNALPVVVATTQQIPELLSVGGTFVGQHASAGRVYVVSTTFSNDPATLVLFDANNDLLFEQHAVMTRDQYEAAFAGPRWITDFKNYFD